MARLPVTSKLCKVLNDVYIEHQKFLFLELLSVLVITKMNFLSIPYRYVADPNFICFGGHCSFIHKGLGCIWIVTKIAPYQFFGHDRNISLCFGDRIYGMPKLHYQL